ncbi:hypothetical protein [Formosa sp. S-31]|uniref:hypothetical protein n=1 Tax=Formosa sp. S-31 TaxID=2790949 RepID=UPI003EB81EB0
MNRSLKPKHTQSVNDVTILWFETSNRYAIIANGLFYYIQLYFTSDSETAFIQHCIQESKLPTTQATTLLNDIKGFLKDLNRPLNSEEPYPETTLTQQYLFTTYYRCLGFQFEINFESESLKEYIHPQIAHLETETNTNADFSFQINTKHSTLQLFKNKNFIKAFEQRYYNKLQGKFNMELLCSLYENTEHDWIGLLHASTISNGQSSVTLIGTSGSGKSTLTSLLAFNGYELMADDTTPILRENLHSYYFPGAISIKQGAFDILKPYAPQIDTLPSCFLRSYKGPIKYLPTPEPTKTHLPCNTVVLVNYQAKAETSLEALSIKEALEILIPDSWLSPKPENAKAFLNWISTLTCYKLTYSNNTEAIAVFSTIFKNE